MSAHAHTDHLAQEGHGAVASGAARNRRALALALALTSALVLAEVLGGLFAGSLALLADAGHTLTDALGMALALAAVWLARRPATASRTFGLYRAEILAALFNSLLPFAIAAFILYEAWQRFRAPHPVQSLPMLGVAVLALTVNLAIVRVLQPGSGESLNVQGAFLEALADLLGAAAVLLAALMVLLTGWKLADPLISVAIGIFILPRAWHLLRSVLDVLLEGTPRNVHLADLEVAMRAVPGVVQVHDLHAWTITSGFVALSGHVEIEGRSSSDVLHDLQALVRGRFGVEHATFQLEPAEHHDDGACCSPDPRCLAGSDGSREAEAGGRPPTSPARASNPSP